MTESSELLEAVVEKTEEQQQHMDHQRFESMFLQHIDIIKAVESMHAELKAIRQQHKEQISFSNIVSALLVVLMAAGFVSMLTIVGFTR